MNGTIVLIARLERVRPRPLVLSLALMAVTLISRVVIRFAHFGLPPVVVKYGGSMLWALMIYSIVSTLLPPVRFSTVASLTAGITLFVEFFKLYHTPALDAFRLTLPGILLLGRFFSAWDTIRKERVVNIDNAPTALEIAGLATHGDSAPHEAPRSLNTDPSQMCAQFRLGQARLGTHPVAHPLHTDLLAVSPTDAKLSRQGAKAPRSCFICFQKPTAQIVRYGLRHPLRCADIASSNLSLLAYSGI